MTYLEKFKYFRDYLVTYGCDYNVISLNSEVMVIEVWDAFWKDSKRSTLYVYVSELRHNKIKRMQMRL